MSLADRLSQAKSKLKQVDVEKTLEDGSVILERRCNDGGFFVIENSGKEEKCSQEGTFSDKGISNRRRKKVEWAAKRGFVVDLTPDLQCANVAKGVYVGSQDVAVDLRILQENGITHIVNCASGLPNFFPSKFIYLKLELLDLPQSDIRSCFEEAHQFMCQAVRNGRVFVHCNAGISRAGTIVLSYIMRFESVSLQAALERVRSVRPAVRPNCGFMQQLLKYDEELRSSDTSPLQ